MPVTKKNNGVILALVIILVGCASTADPTATQEPVQAPTQESAAEESPTQPPPTLERVSLKVGVLPFLSHAPLYIAQQEGFFEALGLDVELVPFRLPTDLIPLLLTGDLDAGVVSVTPSVLNAISGGGQIKYVANKGYYNPDLECVFSGWTARTELLENGGLDDMANMEGLIIGTAPGGLLEYALDRLLALGELTQEDIEFVSIRSQAALLEALGNGAVDIASQGEPWILRSRNAGYADVLISNSMLMPNYDLGLIAYGPNLLGNTEVGQRFMLAYLNAVEFYSEGKTDRNSELVAEYSGLTLEEVKQACWQPIKADGQINVDAIMDFQEWALAKGYIDSVVDPEQFWDSQFIDYANDNRD